MLAALTAFPHSAPAQAPCTSTPAIPANAATGTPPTLTLDGKYTAPVVCNTASVTDGVVLTLGANTSFGTKADPVDGGGDGAVSVDATANDAGASPITVTSNGRVYVAGNGSGINIWRKGAGDTRVTNNGRIRHTGTGDGIRAVHLGTGDITVTHNGTIWAIRNGILAYGSEDGVAGAGNVTVETGEGSSIESGDDGIDIYLNKDGDTGNIKVIHRGMIDAEGRGIFAFISAGTSYNTPGARDADGTGTIAVTAEENSRITAERSGITIWHQGSGKYDITVRGRVTGGDLDDGADKYAGVRIWDNVSDGEPDGGGGTITVGPRGYVGAGNGVAIRADDKTGKATVVLERDAKGLVGHIDGEMLGTMAFETRDVSTGKRTELSAGDTVNRRVGRKPLYTEVRAGTLGKVTGGHRFTDTGGARMLYDSRARLYEALPSVLSGLNGHTPGAARVSAPRGGNGVWLRLERSDGDRTAASATTSTGLRGVALSWEHRRSGLAAGLDLPFGDGGMVLGLSAWHRKGRATVAHGGTAEATGTGLGVTLGHRGADGLYVEGRLSHTRFGDIDLVSSGAEGRIVSGLKGSGLAAGVEVGRSMPVGGVTLTPRGGLSWSSVKADTFDDAGEPGVGGIGRVTVGRAESLVGRLGARAETVGVGAGRLFASLDVEREFTPRRDVTASGTTLATRVRPTRVRLGLGGTLALGAGGSLSAEAFHVMAGGGDTDLGGGIGLDFRF